jgi:heme A synthase
MSYLYQVERIEKQLRATRIINWALVVILITIFIGGLVAGFYSLLTIPEYEITRMANNGTIYECKHYPNGDMSCVDVNDPDVGFGRTQ